MTSPDPYGRVELLKLSPGTVRAARLQGSCTAVDACRKSSATCFNFPLSGPAPAQSAKPRRQTHGRPRKSLRLTSLLNLAGGAQRNAIPSGLWLAKSFYLDFHNIRMPRLKLWGELHQCFHAERLECVHHDK